MFRSRGSTDSDNSLVFSHRIKNLIPPLLSTQRASWEQGAAAQALLECWTFDDTAFPSALDYIYGLMHDSVLRQAKDGRLAVVLNGDGASDAGAVDPACIGESFYHMLSLPNGHPKALSVSEALPLRRSIERMLDFILQDCPRAPKGQSQEPSSREVLSHRIDSTQIWSDSVYMLPPFLASSAVYYSRQSCEGYDVQHLVAMTLDQILLAAEILQSKTGEWSHIYDLQARAFKREAFWGVGNGWACGGIIRVFRIFVAALDEAPPDSAICDALGKADFVEKLQQCYAILLRTLDACLAHMRSDGLFHDILNDTDTFVETNLSQQLAYTLFRLLDLHQHSTTDVRARLHLPPLSDDTANRWEKLANTMRAAAVRKTDRWGFVRDVCGSPHFDRPGTAAEGQTWGILMEVAKAEYESHRKND